VSCDIFLRIQLQNLLLLTIYLATFKYEIKQKFIWLKILHLITTCYGLAWFSNRASNDRITKGQKTSRHMGMGEGGAVIRNDNFDART
jgi:hypothetical protein